METDWRIGDTLQKRWQILDIKPGSMGTIYVVWDSELHDFYAAKTLSHRYIRDPLKRSWFLQEGLAWVQLTPHQNVVQACFVHVLEEVTLIFMEFISSSDIDTKNTASDHLGNWINTPRLTENLPQVLHFALQCCDGLQHILSQGVIAHRDIRPPNCLITSDRVLKVTDFGLVSVSTDMILGIMTSASQKTRQSKNSGWLNQRLKRFLAKLTDTRNRVADQPQLMEHLIPVKLPTPGAQIPHYMAPEIFDDPMHANVQSDIYAFGIMLFQMVTGQLPFSAQTIPLAARLHKTELPPTIKSIPSELNDIIHRCLAKNPAIRFADFAALHHALAKCYQDLTGEAPPQPITGDALTAEQLVNRGHNLSTLGPHAGALRCFEDALELWPNYAPAWAAKGALLGYQEQFEAALACLDRALTIDSNDASTIYNKAIILQRLGQSAQALSWIDHAITLNAYDEHFWSVKGAILDQAGQHEQALACFGQALLLNPRYDTALSNKAATLSSLGQHEEGLTCLEQAIALNPRHPDAWANRGRALGSIGNHAEALACFEQSILLRPRDAKVWCDKGVALGTLGRYEEEIESYQQAIVIDPLDSILCYNLGVAFRERARNDEALQSFERATVLDPHFGAAWYNRGTELLNLGKDTDALACFDRAVEIDPNDQDAWYNKGVVLGRQLGRQHESLVCYERILTLNPHHMYAWNNKGTLFCILGNYHEAITCFEKAQQLGHPHAGQRIADCRRMMSSQSPDGQLQRDLQAKEWFNKSVTLVNIERWQEALTCLDQALALSPQNVNTWVNKGLVLERLKRSEEGIACFDHAISINACDMLAWYNKGSVLGNMGRIPEAIVCFEQAWHLGHPEAERMLSMCRLMVRAKS